MTSRRLIPVGILSGLLLIGWLIWSGFSDSQAASELDRIRRVMNVDRFTEARRLLLALPRAWTDYPEVAYRLGVCHHATGSIPLALESWARVTKGNAYSVPAGLARARTLVGDLGRFAEAEVVLEDLLSQPGPQSLDVRHTLSQLYFWEGRRAAMRRVSEDGFRFAVSPPQELVDHWKIDNAVTLFEEANREVERARALAPDDDRVWLARANLDTQFGKFAESAEILDRCVQRRPTDPAVWMAKLELARSINDVDAARKCLPFIPADLLIHEERLSLLAWIAAKSGDVSAERKVLEDLVAVTPGNTPALERLAVLAWEANQPEVSQQYRRRKADADQSKERYRRILESAEVAPTLFAELGSLAERLGSRFEAQGWLDLARVVTPDDPVANSARARLLASSVPVPPSPATCLADLVVKPGASRSEIASGSELVYPTFTDEAEARGLHFVVDPGRSPSRQLPETTAGGVGLLDFDGDGFLDVYCVQGGTFPPSSSSVSSGDRLYRNRGDGNFEDVTEKSQVGSLVHGYGHGVTVGDFDNDGDPDLFLTRWRAYILLRNRGDGTFEDATETAELGGDRDWPTSAAFADLDNDGDLDLYVCHYLVWDADHPTLCEKPTTPGQPVDPRGRYDYCMPNPFPAKSDHLFRNDQGRFVDTSDDAGITAADRNGRGLGVAAADLDGDGLIDLFVANDTTANYLFRNLGGLKFEEVGLSSGVACNSAGAFQAGMGVAIADLDADGLPDVLVTNFYGESTTFYRNFGGGMFGDQTVGIGLATPSRFLLGFGISALDANNDGRLDLVTANGHVNDLRPSFPYEMPPLLMLGSADGRLTDASKRAGASFAVPRIARALASGDLDNDGRVDMVMASQESPLAYYHNQTPTTSGNSITLRLEGTTSNRDAIGSVLTLKNGKKSRKFWVVGGGSFQTAPDTRVHLGLGEAKVGEEIEVRWPSGKVDVHRGLQAGHGYRLREGEAQPLPLIGFAEAK